MIKGILIDLDNTLYSYDQCHEAGLLSSFVELQKELTDLDFAQFKIKYQDIQKELKSKLPDTASCHHRLLYFQYILEHFNFWSSQACLNLFNSYWDSFFDNMTLFEGALNFLKKAKSKKIPIVIVTDMIAHTQFKKILKLEIDQYISAVVSSEEVGIEKPDEKMFRTALLKINCQANDVIMIGDSFDKDILGAKNAGIKSFWFDATKNFPNNKNLSGITLCSNFRELNDLIK